MSLGHHWWGTNVPCKQILEGPISSNVVIQNRMLVVEKGIPTFNILITSIRLGVLNIFLFLFKASYPISFLFINWTTGTSFLWSSYDICSAPSIPTFGKCNKNLQPSYDSYCELDEYCLAYNSVHLCLPKLLFMRKMWLKLILLSHARTLPWVPSLSR